MSVCTVCSQEVAEGQEIIVRGKGRNAPHRVLCAGCADALEKSFEEETLDINWAGAVLLGLIAGVAACLAWYAFVIWTEKLYGAIAMGVGWLVGTAVIFGAGRKRGRGLQIISAVLTIVVMAFSEYLIVRHFFLAKEAAGVPVLLPLGIIWNFVYVSVKSDPATLFFWGLAILIAFSTPAKRRLQRVNG